MTLALERDPSPIQHDLAVPDPHQGLRVGIVRVLGGGGDATAPVRAVAVVAAAAPHAEPNEKMYDGGADYGDGGEVYDDEFGGDVDGLLGEIGGGEYGGGRY